MSAVPPGFSTIGPIVVSTIIKKKFIEVCNSEDKTMEFKLKEQISESIRGRFPEFVFPEVPVDA
jgi:hypothetical protein